MNFFKILPVLYMLTLLLACAKPERVLPPQNVIFSLTDYFNEETDRLQKAEITLHKSILKDAKIHDTIITNPDWESELSSFPLLDINKKNLIDDYKVDTVYDKNGNYHIFYDNISGKERIKSMSLYFTPAHKLIIMEIVASKNKFFDKELLTYSYQPFRGYGIKGWKKVFFSKKVEIDLNVSFSGEGHPLEVR